MKANISHSDSADGVVNDPEKVTLWHTNGKPMTVNFADLAFWLDQGFRYTKVDLAATLAELKAVFPEALDAVVRYVEGVTHDGEIDPDDTAAQATAQYAMRRLELAWGQLVRDIETLFPIKQGQPVKMRASDGTPIDVDPGQVELYLGQGWSRR